MKIGIDLVEIERVENLRKKEAFIYRICTSYEKKYLEEKNNNSESLAGIFAAKEAMSKAVQSGIGKFTFKDFEIRHQESGAPYGVLEKENYLFNLSISHDGGFSTAVAILKEDELEEKTGILKKRDKNTHKGSFGKVGLIGGSIGMAGSIYLSSMAALRTGSGLVYTLVPKNISKILQIKSVENIVHPLSSEDFLDERSLEEILDLISDYDAIGMGPGFSRKKGQEKLIKQIILNYNKPLILDADGLYPLKNILKEIPTENLVITPHYKEFSRLSGFSLEEIMEDPEKIGQEFMKDFKGVLVLKSHETKVFYKGEVFTNTFGNPGMATAGSGDVLTGIITSIIGQGYSNWKGAKLGVTIHSKAGDEAAKILGEYSLIARDIIKYLPNVLK